MAVDTPARIAILGAGPIGLEAALYARFLGYEVELFDVGEVGENVRRWGHVRLFTPFRFLSTSLGLRALEAQDESYKPPRPDALLTGHEWVDRYLAPLAATDLVADHLRLHTRVVAVARRDCFKHQPLDVEDREESPFHIVTRHRDGTERESSADVVIDATGVYQNPVWIGPGGAPALGEQSLRDRIHYAIPDVLGKDRARFASRRVLVVGCDHSVASTAIALAELAEKEPGPGGNVIWATPAPRAADAPGPLSEFSRGPYAERVASIRQANQLAAENRRITHWPGTRVTAIGWDDAAQAFRVTTAGEHAVETEFDEIVAAVGFRPNWEIVSELQFHHCSASDAPVRLAERLRERAAESGVVSPKCDVDVLLHPEPNFYVLGAKSYGRHPGFLVQIGHQQIRALFALIGDRETLDLYG